MTQSMHCFLLKCHLTKTTTSLLSYISIFGLFSLVTMLQNFLLKFCSRNDGLLLLSAVILLNVVAIFGFLKFHIVS